MITLTGDITDNFARAADADVILIANMPLRGEVIDACPNLKFKPIRCITMMLETEFIFRFSRAIVDCFGIMTVIAGVFLDLIVQSTPA